MGCCKSVNWKKIKEQIAKSLNLDTTFEDNNIKNEKENTIEISNINKTEEENTVEISNINKTEEENTVEISNINKTEEENTVVDVESYEEDFELI